MPTDVEQRLATRLAEGLAELGLMASPAQTAALLDYLRLLQQWNRAYNLTSLTDLNDMVVRHLLDSATVLPFLAGSRVLDAGTGAGLPGLVLAVLSPQQPFTLLDAVGKKVRFLQQAVIELKLGNVTPVHARLESWTTDARFDSITTRAFGSLAEFATRCGEFLAPGGRLVAMKGRMPTEEMAALPTPWQVSVATAVSVPGLDAERHVLVLER